MIESPASGWHCNIARWLEELTRWKVDEAQGLFHLPLSEMSAFSRTSNTESLSLRREVSAKNTSKERGVIAKDLELAWS